MVAVSCAPHSKAYPRNRLPITHAERTLRLSPDHTGALGCLVTAKLSRKFYEKFGDELTNELVEWGNDRRESFRARWTPRIALTYVSSTSSTSPGSRRNSWVSSIDSRPGCPLSRRGSFDGCSCSGSGRWEPSSPSGPSNSPPLPDTRSPLAHPTRARFRPPWSARADPSGNTSHTQYSSQRSP